jgi:hypothetical protein
MKTPQKLAGFLGRTGIQINTAMMPRLPRTHVDVAALVENPARRPFARHAGHLIELPEP